jgi:hypothetical protein
MSFDLRITFTGLFLFIPEQDRVHVLMPVTSDHAHAHHEHGVERHVARLLVSKTHQKNGAGSPRDPGFHTVDLANSFLAIGRRNSHIDSNMEGRELVDLTEIVERKVSRRLLKGADPKRLFSRVTLHAGQATNHAPGAVWTLNGKTQPMTYQVEWTVPDSENSGDSLELMPGKVPTLFPLPDEITGKQTIRIDIVHVPEAELTQPPAKPEPNGNHFLALYDLYENPAARPRPEFVKPPEKGGIRSMLVGVSPETCMAGRGQAEQV